jgi:DNA-binding response OmpR family regulator
MGNRILYVEDSADWRSMVSSALSEQGFDVQTAKNASEAMSASEGADLDLIILDLKLAGESGVKLIPFLKQKHPEVPILLFTGLNHDDATIQAMGEQGADGYLRKGTMQELLQAVRKTIRQDSEVA